MEHDLDPAMKRAMDNDFDPRMELAISRANDHVAARDAVVEAAKRFVQMTRQRDPEGEAEFLADLTDAVDVLKSKERV